MLLTLNSLSALQPTGTVRPIYFLDYMDNLLMLHSFQYPAFFVLGSIWNW
jgi:hypothetical protein